jgi:Fe-S-cluster containining protein
MNNQRARLNFQGLKQVPGHLAMLKKAFSRYNCLECGICCSEKPHEVILLAKDPNRAKILQAASERCPDGIIPINFASFYVKGDNHCPFLDNDDKQTRCSVYSFRPVVCRTFPFLLQSLNTNSVGDADPIKRDFFTLSSICPAIEEARDEGLRFITSYDIRRMRKSLKLKGKLSILIRSYRQIQAYIRDGTIFNDGQFIPSDTGKIIPIF